MKAKTWLAIFGFWLLKTSLMASPIDCFDSASQRYGWLSETEKAILCAGAATLAPVDCLDQTGQAFPYLTQAESVHLCAGATSANAPIHCLEAAAQRYPYLSQRLLIGLCGAPW